MKLHLLLALLVVSLTACDSRDFDSDTFAQTSTTYFDVSYSVTGTYSTCEISYVAVDGTLKTESSSLPWSKEPFSVRVAGSSSTFNAAVHATCQDEERLGKSTASVYVNDELKSKGATTGFGQTASAEFLVYNQ